MVAREGFTDFGSRQLRLELFLAEYGWTGPQGGADDLEAALAELASLT